MLGETINPNNFILENGKTLSIRTSKKSDKIAPRVVGQAGISTFNTHFKQFYDKEIENKNEIKQVVFDNIHLMLPIFFEYLFYSDYTIWFQRTTDNKFNYTIFDREMCLDIEFSRDNFTFTKNLSDWNESTTLKYKGKSIAEIQIHKNRTFKFRFIMQAIISLLREITVNNETFGITAEKTICDVFNLEYPKHLITRSSNILEENIMPTIKKAFAELPKPIKYTGSESGELMVAENVVSYNYILIENDLTSATKCPYDFLLEGNQTLSLKTNTGKMVCPPEVGQPSAKTCYAFFKELCEDTEINEYSFKSMVFNNVDKMLKIYIDHLFDSDYLLWVFQDNINYKYKIYDRSFAEKFEWEKDKISFTKNSIEEWNESNTVKYNNISIGEFQVHKNRNCYKFRFNLENLEKIIKKIEA